MYRLEKVEGPECPECECRDSEVLETVEQTGKRIDALNQTQEKLIRRRELRKCNNCREQWWICSDWESAEKNKKAQPMLIDERKDGRWCPNCGARPYDTRATSTKKGVQYRKCRRCGETFKNVLKA